MMLQDVDAAALTDDQYSYQHLKAFGNHNHLFTDPWNPDCVWLVDADWHVQQAQVNKVRLRIFYLILSYSLLLDIKLLQLWFTSTEVTRLNNKGYCL